MQPRRIFQTPSALEGWLYSVEIVLKLWNMSHIPHNPDVKQLNRYPMSSHVIINIGINIPRCHLWKKIRNIECRQQFFGLMAQKKGCKRRPQPKIWKAKQLIFMTASLPDGCLRCEQKKNDPICFHCLGSLPNRQRRWWRPCERAWTRWKKAATQRRKRKHRRR